MSGWLPVPLGDAMSNLLDALVTLGCAAAGAGASLAMLSVGASPGLAGVMGVAAFGVGSQLQNVGIRRRDRRALDKELVALKRADLIISDQASQTEQRMIDLLAEAERRRTEREDALSAEIKVLETLLAQFGESMVKRVQAVEAQQAQMAGQAKRMQARIYAAPAPSQASGPAAGVDEPEDPHLLDIVQRALIENRVDLHLQPIVSLPQRKLKFYEALSRLRTPDGAVILPADYLRVAERAGLMSTVDNLLLFRCVQFIRRLTARQKDVGVFCNISLASLGDAAFFPQFVDFMRAHRDLSQQIVFELPQSAFQQMGASEESSLRSLTDLGFGISMDRVTSLSLDLDQMRRRGVRFVKLSPALLLDPALQESSGIRLEDFSAILARHGMALIGEKIETERQVVDLLDFGIAYGQGHLFGEPKPLKDDAPEPVRAEPRAAMAASAAASVAAPPAAEAAPAPFQPAGMTALFQARQQRRAAG